MHPAEAAKKLMVVSLICHDSSTELQPFPVCLCQEYWPSLLNGPLLLSLPAFLHLTPYSPVPVYIQTLALSAHPDRDIQTQVTAICHTSWNFFLDSWWTQEGSLLQVQRLLRVFQHPH